MGKISVHVLGAWLAEHRARGCKKLLGIEDIKIQFGNTDKNRIADLFAHIVN